MACIATSTDCNCMMGKAIEVMLRAALERHFNRIWYQRPQPPLIYRWLSAVYAGLGRSRFRRPLARPPVPVIVVGNLTVGGGGKTPLIMALCRQLSARGHAVAVVSRGYGGRHRGQALSVSAGMDPALCGDEAVMIAESTGLPVWVCRRRSRALQAAVDGGAQVVLSDDGLQHAALPRSFEICLIDGKRGLGNGWLLPAGPLRQPSERLDLVDRVLVKGDGRSDVEALRLYQRVVGVARLDGGVASPLQDWHGQAVDAVCGIANPKAFLDSLRELGMTVRAHVFPDHHPYRRADLANLSGPVITTAKDAVKLRRLDLELSIHVLEVELTLPPALTDEIERHLADWGLAREDEQHD